MLLSSMSILNLAEKRTHVTWGYVREMVLYLSEKLQGNIVVFKSQIKLIKF